MPQELSPQLDSILKETSRAFYLSLAVLPAYSRRPLSLAYLLARAADTIADSEGSPLADRRDTLLRYQGFLSTPEQRVDLNLQEYRPEHEGERALLDRVPELFVELWQSEEREQRAIVSVVKTLVDGMLWDQDLFQENADHSGLSMEQLETYTYLVAGCVGPFWSEVCARGDQRLSPLLSDPMVEVAKEFGRGLQWVNILRDIPADQLEGRFYLPELSHPDFPTQFLACSQRALKAFKAALSYPEMFPVTRWRDRISLLLPLVLGLRTLEKLFCDGGPRQGRRVKVSRKEVLAWLAVSPLCVLTTPTYRFLLTHLHQRASKALKHLECKTRES